MEEPLAMHIGQGLECLEDDIADVVVRDLALLLDQLVHVLVQILKDEVELVILFDELDQLHHIGMMQFR